MGTDNQRTACGPGSRPNLNRRSNYEQQKISATMPTSPRLVPCLILFRCNHLREKRARPSNAPEQSTSRYRLALLVQCPPMIVALAHSRNLAIAINGVDQRVSQASSKKYPPRFVSPRGHPLIDRLKLHLRPQVLQPSTPAVVIRIMALSTIPYLQLSILPVLFRPLGLCMPAVSSIHVILPMVFRTAICHFLHFKSILCTMF